MTAYYNEFEPYAAQWLRNLIAAGLIPAGDVDDRSIVDVRAADLDGYTQCHFFAGIGGWALATRIAGWPDDRELWTGSPPCQPFSVAGKQRGADDERHLWPELFRLIDGCKPATFMGEQVAAAVGKNWLDGVFSNLEGIGYACGAAVVPACAVDAPHRRDRLWFFSERNGVVDHGERARLEGFAGHGDDASGRTQPNRPTAETGSGGAVEHTDERPCGSREFMRVACDSRARARGAWAEHDWIIGHDGKARRVEPSIRLLAHGVPARVGRLRAYGNAIVPSLAAEIIGAYMDTTTSCAGRQYGSTIRPADMTGDSRGPDPCTSCAEALS